MSYNNPEYGGGGSTGANYYDPNANFSDTRYTGPPRFAEADFTSAAHHATSHHDGGNSALFDNALSFIKERAGSLAAGDNGSNQHEINEEHAMRSHQALFGAGSGGAGESHDDQSVGAGAAMQALKLFMERGGQHEGGFDLNQLVGLAMAQAGKAWDEKEGSGASMVCSVFPFVFFFWTSLISSISVLWSFGSWIVLTLYSPAINSPLSTTPPRWP